MGVNVYETWSHAGLTSDAHNMGEFRVYRNKPEFYMNLKFPMNGASFWWKLQDGNIANDDYLDDASSFTINYNPEYTGQPGTVLGNGSGQQLISGSFNVNPIFPWATEISTSSATTTRPTGGTDIGFKSWHKGWQIMNFMGWDVEYFAVTLNGTIKDNTYNKNVSSYSVDRGNNQLIVNLKAALPSLINADTTSGEGATASCNGNKYNIALDSTKHYRLQSSFSSPGTGSDQLDTGITDIVFYNDYITINPYQLGNISGQKCSGNVLTWNAVTNASSYNVYCDGVYKATVTKASYTIPDDIYYDQKHSYSVEVCDKITESYNYKTVKGYKTLSSYQSGGAKSSAIARRNTTLNVYKGVNAVGHANWNNVGLVNAPGITKRKNKLNSWTWTVTHSVTLGIAKLYYKVITTDTNFDSTAMNPVTNATVTLDKLKVNTKYSLEFYVTSTINGIEHWSTATKDEITPAKYPAPSISKINKTAINAYDITFSASTTPNRYEVWLNEEIVKGDARSPINVPKWKANQNNTIKIISVYEEDETYNNELIKVYDASKTPLLGTPVLSKKDNYENNVDLILGDSEQKEVSKKPVITSVTLSWTAPEYSSGYVLYDEYTYYNNDMQAYETGIRTIPPQTSQTGTEIMDGTEFIVYPDNIIGEHKYYVKAVSKTDETYNSNDSNAVVLHQNYLLDPPVMYVDNTTTTIEIEPVDNADFYSIQLTPRAGVTNAIFASFEAEGSGRTSFNYYDLVKNLRESENFIVHSFSRSYDAFYFHPSHVSETSGTCKVIKLNTPRNLEWSIGTSDVYITWEGDYDLASGSKTDHYDVYIKAIDGDKWNIHQTTETSITLPIGNTLYSLYIVARRNNELTNHQPVYLDSEESEVISFGTIRTPEDFERHVNKFSWSSSGADRYVFYEWIEKNEENADEGPYQYIREPYVENGEVKYKFKLVNEGGNWKPESLTTIDGAGVSVELGMTPDSRYRPTEGEHHYSVRAYSNIAGVEWESFLTDPITVNIEYLPTPMAEFLPGTSVAEWTYDKANVVMDPRVNNISEIPALEYMTKYTIDKNEVGFYTFKVRAISTIDSFLYQTSEFCPGILYEVYQLNKPELDLTIVDNGGIDFSSKFFWTHVAHANTYNIVARDSKGEIVLDDRNIDAPDDPVEVEGKPTEWPIVYYNYGFNPGNYSAYVIAKGTSLNYPNPKYLDSEMSNVIKFGKLDPPQITIDENIISWERQENADYYEIYNYNKYFAQTDNSTFILDVSKPYSYSVRVIAKSFSKYIIESELGNSIQYIVTQLNAPTNLRIDGDQLLWDKVVNADFYKLYMDGVEILTTTGLEYDLSEVYANKAGIVGFTVRAFSNQINFLTSEHSNSVKKNITKLRKYNVTIEGKTYDEIQLPFEIHLTLDETLDDAGLTIAYIDRAEPFERFSTATLTMYEGPSPSRRYDMVVMSDEVSSIQIGNEIKYKHALVLVEQTIKLQNIMVPDFTVSAPLATKVLPINSEVIAYNTGGNYIPGNKWSDEFDGDVVASGKYHYIGDVPTGWLVCVGLTDNFKGHMKNVYEIGDEIILPTAAGRLSAYAYSLSDAAAGAGMVAGGVAIGVGATIGGAAASGAIAGSIAGPLGTAIGAGVGALIGTIGWLVGGAVAGTGVQYVIDKIVNTDNNWPFPKRVYKIRPHKTTYDPTPDETIIRTCEPAQDLGLVNYKFDKEGVYDIILEVPAVNLQDLVDKGLIDVKFLGDLFGDINERITLPSAVNYMRKGGSEGEPCTFRVVWHGINVIREINTFKPKKLSWVLQKVMELVGHNYTIDPAILALTDSIESPDFTFSGGKLLYDVLEEIGREFKGIPRLLNNNVITFDILDETVNNGMTLWRDYDVMYNQSQDLDNIAGGFVTRISNMVADDDITYYPAPNRWIKSRGEPGAGAVVDISNLSIVVDKPIYKLKQVLLKNCFEKNKETVLDITDYIYQSEMYDTLNNNMYGKGLALKWDQGGNIIRGLGQLPEESKLYAAIGWSSDKYVIQNIIENCLKRTMDNDTAKEFIKDMIDPTHYVYQIKYQGYVNTTSFIEDSNANRLSNHFYKIFNQESNTVSDDRFGHSALTQLKRHNGNFIKKEYMTDSFSFIPLLGQHIMVGETPYYIDELKYTFDNALIKTSVNFSKNYNKINPKVNIKSEYRQFELQVDSNVDRSVNFNNYCYIGERIVDNENKRKKQWINTLNNAFNMNTEDKLSTFYFNCYANSNLDKIKYLTIDENTALPVDETIEGIAIPASYNRIATSIQYCAQMEDSFSAGRAIRYKDPGNKDNKKMVQEYVRYVGDESTDQTPLMRITLGDLPAYIGNSYEETYPKINWFEQPTVSMNNVHLSELVAMKKDQRERLGFNYQMHFISNRSDIQIHKGMTKYIFKNNDDPKKTVRPILVAHYENLTHKDILTNYTKIKDLVFDKNSANFDCTSNVYADKNYTGLAVIWPDTKEILLEIRKPISKGAQVNAGTIWFNLLNEILR